MSRPRSLGRGPLERERFSRVAPRAAMMRPGEQAATARAIEVIVAVRSNLSDMKRATVLRD